MNGQKKILIVDDDAINLDFFDVMLSKLGFVVEKADDGVQALEKIKRFSADLVILNNVLPHMSGWELTRTLKNDPRYRNIPIIMFSALDDAKDKVEGFELGIDDYITKPFNFSEVLARIRTVLRNREIYTQILARESRLRLAEDFNADMRRHLVDLVKSIDELDAVIAEISSDEGETKRTHEISKKSRSVRKYIAELDERIEKVVSEWGRLKKMEISLPNLEARFSASINATAASVDPADTVSADAVSASA